LQVALSRFIVFQNRFKLLHDFQALEAFFGKARSV
jgi:hypothetical protein